MRAFIFALMMMASPAAAELFVVVADGDEADQIYVLNRGPCALVTGRLTIDFAKADYDIVIDTEYGGRGVQDPLPVLVAFGPLKVAPVADGDTSMVIDIGGLPPGQPAAVYFDMDEERSWFFEDRVWVSEAELEGAEVFFQTKDFGERRRLDGTGAVTFDLPPEVCVEEVPEDEPETGLLG